MRTLCVFLVVFLVLLMSVFLVFVSPWLARVFFLAAVAFIAAWGWANIPANPPHKGILTFWGKRLNVVLDEGWHYFPFRPLFNFIPVKVEKINIDLEPQVVRTPDRAEIQVSAGITYIPGIVGRPDSLITYLNSGGESGVRKILHDMIEDRIKTWAASNREGPSSWMEALALRDEVLVVLVKLLLGSTLEEVDNKIPTNTLMRYYDSPQGEPTEYDCALHDEKRWAEKKADGTWNWDGLKAILEDPARYTPEQKLALEARLQNRREAVRKMREGKGDFGDESLGITIARFTVNEVKVIGKVAEAAEQAEKERKEQEADEVEIKNISARAKKLMEEHPGLTSEQALNTVQVERGKATRKIFNVDAPLATAIKELKGILQGGGGNPPAGT